MTEFNAHQIAKSLAAVMSDDAKAAFISLFESGNTAAAKSMTKTQIQKHSMEQQIIGSHALTSPNMQQGLCEIAFGLLSNGTELKLNEFGELEEVPA